MLKRVSAQVRFDVCAVSEQRACDKTFAVFVAVVRRSQTQSDGNIWRPVINWRNPKNEQFIIHRRVVTFPVPGEQGDKQPFLIELDICCTSSDGWNTREEAWKWIRDLFQPCDTPDVHLAEVRESIINWS